jgi:hypothetical protein
MKIGTRITHIYNPKAQGVIVTEVGDDLRILWDTDTIPRLHPRGVIVPLERAAALPDTIDPVIDEEDEGESGVSELSLEITGDPDETEEAEEDSNSETVEPEIIEHD